ncbi:uncharacterized protein G2W53_039626 [Senna tora]|uniref:Uncharacterized protein n=1 Tax=Senna tora TaxID=362788 RepID=A0A834SR76_9FABA|nr:uncharacterized protein G2W53_039626 [Senna tora]
MRVQQEKRKELEGYAVLRQRQRRR